jgi:hypothetical protein
MQKEARDEDEGANDPPGTLGPLTAEGPSVA